MMERDVFDTHLREMARLHYRYHCPAESLFDTTFFQLRRDEGLLDDWTPPAQARVHAILVLVYEAWPLLSASQQQVLYCHCLERRTEDTMASHLHLSLAQVREHLHEAGRVLAHALGLVMRPAYQQFQHALAELKHDPGPPDPTPGSSGGSL